MDLSEDEHNNVPDKLLKLLRRIAKPKTNAWRESLETLLSKQEASLDRYDEIVTIYDLVFRDFENADDSRWYDPYHILFSTGFALRLVLAKRSSSPNIELMIPAILLHDIGYYAVPDKTQWSGKDSRTVHMQEGAARAARVLWECGKRFTSEEVERIIGMIAVHDNPYLGIPIGDDRLRQALRDCDRVWVMHALSFYKDWAHKKADYPGDSGIMEFLVDRAVQFYGIELPSFIEKLSPRPLLELVKKNCSRLEPPNCDTTRTLIDQLFERRIEEIGTIKSKSFQNSYKDLGKHKNYLADRIDGDFALLETL